MPDDKKKQAMSLLFGDAPAKPKPQAPERTEASPSPEATEKPLAEPPPPETPTRREEPPSGRGGERPTPPDASVTPDPYYQGSSRYRRASGEQVKHSVYLDSDVSRALKIAAATGDDSRGTNVSAIVNAALRELGYGENS
jgi:hypothetical protein